MMLFALAMMAQDIPLNAEASEAMKCARAMTVNRPADEAGSVTAMVQSIYFLMRAADADPVKGGRFVERTGEIAPLMVRDGPAPAEAPAILARCDQRYPLARSTAPVNLPSDKFDRDMLCASVASYLVGAVEGSGLTTGVTEIRRVQQAYLAGIPDDVLRKHGITSGDQIIARMDAVMHGTLKLGNIEQIHKACAAAL